MKEARAALLGRTHSDSKLNLVAYFGNDGLSGFSRPESARCVRYMQVGVMFNRLRARGHIGEATRNEYKDECHTWSFGMQEIEQPKPFNSVPFHRDSFCGCRASLTLLDSALAISSSIAQLYSIHSVQATQQSQLHEASSEHYHGHPSSPNQRVLRPLYPRHRRNRVPRQRCHLRPPKPPTLH